MKVKKNTKLSAEAERSLSPAARYVLRMHRFADFYRLLILCMGIVSALAIVVAVVANVLVGLCAAIAVITVYTVGKRDALQKHLALRCESAADDLCVTALSARNEDTLFVPAYLMGLRVTALAPAVFENEKNATVTALYLPATLHTLERDTLAALPALTTVFFDGTPDEWETIAKEIPLENITLVPNTPYPSLKTAPYAESASSNTDGEVTA